MKNDYLSVISDISKVYREMMMTEAVTPATIRLIFIKYAADNYLYAESKEDMIQYAEVHKNIAGRNVRYFIDSVMSVLQMIDYKIHAKGLLANAFPAYSDDLLGEMYKKKTFGKESSDRILGLLSSIDLSEDEADKGKVFEALKEYIYDSLSVLGRRSAETKTEPSLIKLVKKILNVNETDTFMDFSCGYGLSSLEITEDGAIHLYLSDIREDCLQIAIMLSIIQGKSTLKTTFEQKDVFNYETGLVSASKIFSDFPLKIRLDRTQYPSHREGTILAIYRMIDYLENGGTAIITCASGILYSVNREARELREYLLGNRLLKAVITLPPINPGVSVNINLLILSKQNNESVMFIDATNNEVLQFSNNARHFNSRLIDSGIDHITDILSENKEITGVSKLVSCKEVIEKNTLVPTAYIDYVKQTLDISSKEIEQKLDDLYEQLFAVQNHSKR